MLWSVAMVFMAKSWGNGRGKWYVAIDVEGSGAKDKENNIGKGSSSRKGYLGSNWSSSQSGNQQKGKMNIGEIRKKETVSEIQSKMNSQYKRLLISFKPTNWHSCPADSAISGSQVEEFFNAAFLLRTQ